MKRFTTVLAALTLAVAAGRAEAQVLLGYLAGDKLSSEQFNIGFDVGMNIGTLTGLGSASRTKPALFGLLADWRFSDHFHLGFGLLPISGRGAADVAPQPIGDPALDSLIAGGTMTRKLGTIDVPILLRYAPKKFTGIRVGIGPELGFVTSAHDRYTATGSAGTPVIVEQNIGSRIANVDAGIAFDVEWRFPMLAIGARYYYGLTDLGLGTNGAKSYSRVIQGSGRIALGKRNRPAPAAPQD